MHVLKKGSSPFASFFCSSEICIVVSRWQPVDIALLTIAIAFIRRHHSFLPRPNLGEKALWPPPIIHPPAAPMNDPC